MKIFAGKMLAGVAVVAALSASPITAQAQPPAQISQSIVKAAQDAVKKDDLEGAARLYETAIVANPASVDAYVGLGKAQAALKRPNAATRYFDTAVKIDPNSLPALEAQSSHQITLGDLADAEKNINRLRRLCVNGCAELSTVLKSYEKALDANRARVLGEGAEGS